MKKNDNKKLMNHYNNRENKRYAMAKVFMVIVGFIIITGCISVVQEIKQSKQIELENKKIEKERAGKEELEKNKAKEEEKKKALASQSVDSWISYKENDLDANYDKENNILYVSLNFGRSLSVKNRIELANYDIYEITKEVEELFPEEIKSYKFSFLAKAIDKYGNEKQDIVYSIILNETELNKVNWEGIEPSMLINLASQNYKSPLIQ